MKTMIVYATKHGFAEKCSKLLKDKLSGEVITVNIKFDKIYLLIIYYAIAAYAISKNII